MNVQAICRALAAGWLLAVAGTASAASLNKCTGTDGAVFYTDRPCPGAGIDVAPPRQAAPARVAPPDAKAQAADLASLRLEFEQLQRRCATGDAGACAKARTYRLIIDNRVELKRRCDAGEALACDFQACETTLDPVACARAQGRPVDSGYEVRRRQDLGPGTRRISIHCLPSRIGRSVYEDRASGRFDIRRNPNSPVVASFESLDAAADYTCKRPAP